MFNFSRLTIPRDLSKEGVDDCESTLAYDRVSRWPFFKLIRFFVIRELLKYRPQGTLLDCGCGPGYLALEIALHLPQLRITGIDIADDMLKLASSHLSTVKYQPQVSLIKADIQRLPFEDSSFDFAVSTLSLHHWSDPHQALREIHRVLKSGGQMLIFDLRRDMPGILFGLISGVQRFLAPRPIRRINGGAGSVWSSYTPAEMQDLLRNSPFNIGKIQARWGWAYLRGQKNKIIKADRTAEKLIDRRQSA